MRRFLISILIINFSLLSCTRHDEAGCSGIETFTGHIPIVSTTSPMNVTVGEKIRTELTLQLTERSGSIYFTGFEVKDIAFQRFDIKARALFKDWNKCIVSPVLWRVDTSLTIQTSLRGKYILNFYNASKIFRSDTVEVN